MKSILTVPSRPAVLFLLALTMLAGLAIRFDNMKAWNKMPAIFLADGEPLLINLDGYYYLGLARDLLDSSYAQVDEKRAVPESPQRPSPPPLLSVMLSALEQSGLGSLNWLGVTVPVLLSILLTIPIFLFSKQWGTPVMSVTATGLALLAPYYILRTKVGVLDTDCLNATLAMSCACSALYFARAQGRRKILWLAVSLLLYLLFLWWWDQTTTAVTILAMGPFFLACLLSLNCSSRRTLLLYTIMGLGITALLLFIYGTDFPSVFYDRIRAQLSYISKQETGPYQNIGTTIGEQVRPSFNNFVSMTASNIFLFSAAAIGTMWLMLNRKKEFLVLLPILTIGLFGYFFAVRFTIFLIPVLALGLGYLFSEIGKRKNLAIVSYGAAVLMIGYMTYTDLADKPVDYPIFNGQVIHGMAEIEKITPQESVVWSWWNEGHPLVYWARRSTISDGMIHGGERSHFNAVPLSTGDYRLAANFMQFFQTRGIHGISQFTQSLPAHTDTNNVLLKQVLAAGPDQARSLLIQHDIGFTQKLHSLEAWLEFLFPAKPRPTFLFLDNHLIQSHLWTYWFGTWDTEKHIGKKTLLTFSFAYKKIQAKKIMSPSGAIFDFAAGEAGLQRYYLGTVPVYQAALTRPGKATELLDYPENSQEVQVTYNPRFTVPPVLQPLTTNRGRYELEIHQPSGHALFQDYRKAMTITNRLFWRNQDFDTTYFKPVQLNTPHYQIWQVRGDRFIPGKKEPGR